MGAGHAGLHAQRARSGCMAHVTPCPCGPHPQLVGVRQVSEMASSSPARRGGSWPSSSAATSSPTASSAPSSDPSSTNPDSKGEPSCSRRSTRPRTPPRPGPRGAGAPCRHACRPRTGCMAPLRWHRMRQAAARAKAGELWPDSDYVFTTRTGRPAEPRNVYRSFTRIAQSAGLRVIRLHDARHGTVTLLTAAGVAPRVVMEILGHSPRSASPWTCRPTSSRTRSARP